MPHKTITYRLVLDTVNPHIRCKHSHHTSVSLNNHNARVITIAIVPHRKVVIRCRIGRQHHSVKIVMPAGPIHTAHALIVAFSQHHKLPPCKDRINHRILTKYHPSHTISVPVTPHRENITIPTLRNQRKSVAIKSVSHLPFIILLLHRGPVRNSRYNIVAIPTTTLIGRQRNTRHI